MNCWNDSLKVKGSCISLRVVERKEHFFDPPNFKTPKRPVIFEVNSIDVEHGKSRNMQPLVSLWDDRVPFLEILRKRKLVFKKTGSFSLCADEINNNVVINPLGIPVVLVKDKIEKSLIGRFHYGLQGLYYDKKLDKKHKSKFILIREEILEKAKEYSPSVYKNVKSIIFLFSSLLSGKE
ncbi:MAG: hypothetical protein M9962_15040 [Oligoflexia bacterium]|nr:hypothetical protein [Oligoflexia bacterium]